MPGKTIDIGPVRRGRGDNGPTYYAGDTETIAIETVARGAVTFSGDANAPMYGLGPVTLAGSAAMTGTVSTAFAGGVGFSGIAKVSVA